DTGADPIALRRALGRNSVTSLDAVLVSHLDADHCGALAALSGNVRPQRIYWAADLLTAQADAPAINQGNTLVGATRNFELQAGDVLTLSPQLRLVVLGPTAPAQRGDNADSLILSLDYDQEGDGRPEFRVLLTGDAESPDLTALLDTLPDYHCTVLKVPHHGSRASVSADLLASLDCQVALVSVGADNNYGHPTDTALNLLAAANIPVFRTDQLGDIHLRFDTRGLVLSYTGHLDFWSF
ncbi:MAG: DNA internalization-related competence protein ComEC/Rec2, partial [Actinomycetia bacterium]|nr:DNA internalization-related competence protein ComEC/Rec2 [Actinomycetes bacterium]